MKTTLLTIVALAITLTSFGQAPEGFKYQAVVRDAGGVILTNQAVGVQLTIQQGSIGGTAVYTETFAPSSNGYGLVNLEIGTGTTTDDFTTIDWANGPYFMETALDVTGGVTYVVMGTSQLMSVPYALHARNSDSWYLDGDTTNTDYHVDINSPRMHLEGSNFTDLIVSNNAVGDPNIWLRDVDSSITWRIHNDQSRGNIFSIRPWTDYSGFGGTTWLGLNSDPFSIDTAGRVSVGNGTGNFKQAFNVYHQDSAFINIETSGNNEAGLVMSELGGARGARILVDGTATNNLIFQVKDDLGEYVDVMHMPYFPGSQVGNVGIGTDSPARKLHINDVMRLEPRATAPANPSKGDMYMDDTTNKLMVYDGSTWQACW
ncbi:MAG: hypothetical protein QNK85_04135 [Crocinitomicaceae bacterium]|jgi:hypothetical protein